MSLNEQLFSVILQTSDTQTLIFYSFWETFIIGQNINNVHVTYSFHELLIFF